jgi:hypothetical protein
MTADPHNDWQGTPEQWAQFERELDEEFPEETARFNENMDALARIQSRPAIEYCEEVVEEGGRVKMCDAALKPDGRCPYEKHHMEEL